MQKPSDQEAIVFNTALELSGTERTAYLQGLGAEQADLRRRIEGLLRAHEASGVFLEAAPVVDLLADQPVGAFFQQLRQAKLEKPGDLIGRYKLLEQIGEGGCGIVYMAEQQEPVRRRVALKVIKLGMDTRQVIARFEAERQALALMDHPNIARVFDAGVTETGRPFFVMELVRGVKITEYCDRNNIPTQQRLELFTKVCQAVQHAHQKGIIHRDIKPSNLLVTVNDGVAMPKVIDFGIAKATSGKLTDHTLFTAFEQFLGTPAYMSPEQAVMTSLDIDTRTDIYSLGVLLYELLTGTTPFEKKELLAAGIEEMRRTIQQKEPLRPSIRLSTMTGAGLAAVAQHHQAEPPKLLHQVRGDLDWIVMKCLEKERGRRYETANSLAQDVRCYLDNEPIGARPPSNLYRFQKLVRRHKLAVTSAGAVFTALVGGLVIATWQYGEKSKAEHEQGRLRLAAEKAEADESRLRQVAETQELASRKRAYAADMNLLQKALAEDDLARAQELLDRQRPASGQKDLRGWEWRYFWQFCQSDAAFTLCQRSNSVISVSFSSDGSLLAVGTWQGEITVWDVTARKMIFQHDNDCKCPRRVAFAPEGNLLAYYEREPDKKKNIVLWDGRTRAEVRRLPVHDTVRDLAFARDGTLFTAEQSISNNVTVWDVTNGLAIKNYTARVTTHLSGSVFNVAPDGSRSANSEFAAPNVAQIFAQKEGASSDFQAGDEFISALTFSPDSQKLVTGTGFTEGTVTIWDFHAQKQIAKMEGHRGWISGLKFLPDGRTLVSSSADRTIRLWDFETHKLIRTLRGYNGSIWALTGSPDGRWLASGSEDGSVVFWDLNTSTNQPAAYRSLQPTIKPLQWDYSPNGKFFAVMEKDQLELLDATNLQLLVRLNLGQTNLLSFSFSSDTRYLATTDKQGHLSIWDLAHQQLVTNLDAHSDLAEILGFMSGNKELVTLDVKKTARVWDATDWHETRHWNVAHYSGIDALCPRTGACAIGDLDSGSIELIDAYHPENRKWLQSEKRLEDLGFSSDGKTLFAVEQKGALEFWDTQSGIRTARLSSAGLGSYSVAMSPDGERVAASGDGRQAVKLWDFTSREEVATLVAKGSNFRHLVFSPDGNTLAARNQTWGMDFWSAPSWEQIASVEKARERQSP